ncbi:MAG: MFS transporter [Microvirga sp.]|nr:MFS transporter [Microvirga sp.]
MTDAIRPLLALLAAVALLMAGAGPLTTLISVRLEAQASSTLTIGLVMGSYFAGLTAGSLLTFHLVTRVGHIRAFAAFAAVMTATTLAYPLLPDPLFWAALRLTQGFVMAGMYVCIESWLNDGATARNRGVVLATYMTCLYLALSGGQLLIGLPDESGYMLFIVTAILLSLAAAPVAVTRIAPPTLPDIASLSFRRLYEASPLGVFGVFSSGLILGSIYSLAPVYATGSGLDLVQTSQFMSALILGGVALQWPVGRLSDLVDRRTVIVGVIVAGALTSAAMLAAPMGGYGTLLILGGAFGGLCFVLYPLCVAHTNDHLANEERIGATGGLILANSVGATIGPPLAAGVMSLAGPSGLFIFTGLIGIGSIGFAVWRLAARPSVPAELQGPYQSLPNTTPVAAALDPNLDVPADDDRGEGAKSEVS